MWYKSFRRIIKNRITGNKGNRMKSLKEQLSNYKSVHLNHKNVITHFVGVPMILWSISLLLSGITFNVDIFNIKTLSLLPVTALVVFVYYFLLDIKMGFFATIILSPLFYSASIYSHSIYFYSLIFSVFVIGWLFQFVGHFFEKAKPAFIDDLNQLLIGPLFLIAEIYFSLGFNKKLADEVLVIAKNKRKNLNAHA